MKRIRRGPLIVVLPLAALLTIGCVSFGVDEYHEFKSAVASGATCEQLFDIATGFDGETRARIDNDLRKIGCTDRDAERNDR